MPTYEMPLLLRVMKKPELVAVLKRTAETIFNTGGFIRKIENCGVIPLPCKTNAHGHIHREANHFLIYFDVPPNEVDKIVDKYNRDIDIVRTQIFKQNKPFNTKCTLHEEMLPPPYRPSVQKLMEMAKKQNRNKREFKYNTGLDYYPFNK
ncbi:PREDICTED: probable 28S ribosomal protein S6, mitochondrial [Trachymyrmex cornetzi]|uniref:Small ribosomal subunit protein bS6m n=1 Tax=Trachymyrmex cornetzi TaxID=471704 RepID=A0A195D7P8_9HYME|nr:PREDICTED: probable 28S ribosomal protein S6, mitochondrial [Trachymyrmex cornetzi]KYN08888.1 putative 28S ribosomal protein S6, mitochondrial [Trachymyrmex cornetzi]